MTSITNKRTVALDDGDIGSMLVLWLINKFSHGKRVVNRFVLGTIYTLY